jgi:DNA modification methylase
MSTTLLHGHNLDSLKKLPSALVHCCVTSPPYWGLRDYGIPSVQWPTGWYGCHGLEPSIDLYIEHSVLIFREVRRVLRHDGTLWLNLGDTYAGGGLGGGGSFACDGVRMCAEPGTNKNVPHRKGTRLIGAGIKNKDLVGVPWRVAFALQADGWYLRCDNIWNKPNPMPESVRDRPTRAHEYVFLLSKSKRYFYDLEGVKEDCSGTAHSRGNGVNPKAKTPGRNSRVHLDRDVQHSARPHKQNRSFSAAVAGLVSKRNMRSVWNISTAPFRGAHFATFPPKLAERCIRAGTSEKGCCPSCGSPWSRITRKGSPDLDHQRLCGGDKFGKYSGKATKNFAGAGAQNASAVKARILAGMVETLTVGFEPSCSCVVANPSPIPCAVLDPFAGSGTVGEVAKRLGRSSYLIELNPDYITLAEKRCGL